MADATDKQFDAALLVRRRLQAELIACEAVADDLASVQVARLKLKLRHLDSMIARFEQELGHTEWWSDHPPGGHAELPMTA